MSPPEPLQVAEIGAAAGISLARRRRFWAVAANLLLNASQAVQSTPEPEIGVELSCAHDTLRISVTDNGAGVPPTEAEAIFLPFVNSKVGGAGIGLHLARSAIRSLGGDIVLSMSAAGRVNRFSLQI